MKLRFEDEEGVIIKEIENNVFLPRKGDLIYLDGNLFCVSYLCFDYDNNIIEVNVEHQ